LSRTAGKLLGDVAKTRVDREDQGNGPALSGV
jgi:hypothetical protein